MTLNSQQRINVLFFLKKLYLDCKVNMDQSQSISNESLPKSMRYGMSSATAVPATSVLSRFASVNGSSFTPTGSNQIRFRVQAPGFLDVSKHFLEFTATVATADAFVDGDAGSFFDRIRIESNGAVVEEILSAGLYNNIRNTYDTDLGSIGKLSVSAGAGSLALDNVVVQTGLAAGDTAAAVKVVTDAAFNASNGLVVEVGKGSLGQPIPTNGSHTFCIQLQSGLLRNTHGKALPDGTAELDIILTLAADAQALIGTGAHTYTISSPTLYCPTYRIENAMVMNEYRQMMLSRGVQISGQTAKTYINTLSNGTGVKSLQINDRSLSLLGLVTAVRPTTADSTGSLYSNSSYGFTVGDDTTRISRYHYQIGGTNFPQSDVNIGLAANGRNLGRVHDETLRALAQPGETYAKGAVTIEQMVKRFDRSYVTPTNNNSLQAPKGLLSVDLKKFDMEKLRMVGLNTSLNSGPSVLEVDVTTSLAADASATTFALCECFFSVLPNGMVSVAI